MTAVCHSLIPAKAKTGVKAVEANAVGANAVGANAVVPPVRVKTEVISVQAKTAARRLDFKTIKVRDAVANCVRHLTRRFI